MKVGWGYFKRIARGLGYTRKVVGEYAFMNKAGKAIKLKAIKGDTLMIWEEGKGIRHERWGGITDRGKGV